MLIQIPLPHIHSLPLLLICPYYHKQIDYCYIYTEVFGTCTKKCSTCTPTTPNSCRMNVNTDNREDVVYCNANNGFTYLASEEVLGERNSP